MSENILLLSQELAYLNRPVGFGPCSVSHTPRTQPSLYQLTSTRMLASYNRDCPAIAGGYAILTSVTPLLCLAISHQPCATCISFPSRSDCSTASTTSIALNPSSGVMIGVSAPVIQRRKCSTSLR